MAAPLSARARALVLGLAASTTAGCNFELDSPFYISHTKLLSVEVGVVELGPLNPGRVGVPTATPIAEPMPGDRIALEAVVVDVNGHVLDGDELDSLWFQCGAVECGGDLEPLRDELERPCDALEPATLDDMCRVGGGGSRVEFVVGELAEQILNGRVAYYYGVFAWDGRRAEDCWADRVALDGDLDGCAFTLRPIKIGPSWWMLAYGEQLGFPSTIPLWQMPAPIFGQFANRVPSPRLLVRVDGQDAGAWPDTQRFAVAPGSEITVDSEYDELEQLTQAYFLAAYQADLDKYWFSAGIEVLFELGYSAGALHAVESDIQVARPRNWVIDPYAPPGVSQLFVVYSDDRYGEGVAQLEFEVSP